MKQNNKYIVGKEDAGKTLKEYLKGRLQYSHRSVVSLKKNSGVTINGAGCHMNVILNEADVVELCFYEEESENILPEKMELDILFEDDSLVVVNKMPNMPVHPVRRYPTGTLANGLAHYLLHKGAQIKIRPINRLDKDTSGLVVFAKHAHIQHLLSFYVGKEEFKKEYIALVHGQMERQKTGTIDAPIAREAERAITRVVRADGDRAVTHYEVLESYEDYSVVRVLLETGSTHQIRVHMAYIGHPLLGDTLYGGSTERIARQALHAQRITLLHPITKKWHCFTAPIPEDMKELL